MSYLSDERDLGATDYTALACDASPDNF